MKRKKFFFPALICWLLFSCQPAPRIHRKLYVPDEFPTLEEAVKNSISGDIIVVRPGEYSLPVKGLHITQKNLTLFGLLGAKKTILMGTKEATSISFGKNSQATLDGFTLTTISDSKRLTISDPNQRYPLRGGGIYCAPSSSPTIAHNIIINHKAQFGGGIYCAVSSSPKIFQNTIIHNRANICGGGIFSFHASARILKNSLIQNTAHFGGGIFCEADNALIQNNIIVENKASYSGGGCSCIDSSATLLNNTLAGNRAFLGGGVFGLAGKFRLLNTILWKNQDDLCLINFKMVSRPRFCNISDADYLGINGNISKDPLFIDPNQGNYRLAPGSPCLQAGDPQKIYNNPDGSRNTIGALKVGPRL